MLDFPKWKTWSMWATVVLCLLLALPNALEPSQLAMIPDGLPKSQLPLGLDLRGGSHLMLEATPQDVEKAKLETLEDTVRGELRAADGGAIAATDLSLNGGRLSFTVADATRLDQAIAILNKATAPLGVGTSREVEISRSSLPGQVIVTPTSAGIAAAIDGAMAQAVEVIRKRIDELGTREPTIVRQGKTRIVVQVPGLQDPEALKQLLGKTAKLEFKLVDTAADAEEVAQGRAPPGSQILPSQEGGQVVVKRRAIITGDQLVDSQVTTDQNGAPAVSFRFDSTGGRRFAQATTENVGKPFAILLDGMVISAPNINEPILGGSGIIQGNYTVQTANDLAILLRSGKLPVELKVVEERTVGPDLGADSIKAGIIASIVSVLAVALLMIMTYGRFGVYSVIALTINVLMILGIMSAAGFTLTLPGIAGMVLTIGAAVDANVLINERIREEQRKGRGVVTSVETGFKEASRTIWDANSLNIIVAIIMFLFGSGPIKGFAVVLSIGIATSVFTAVTIVRWMVARWLTSARPATLSI
ncbi:protein translocase subunit SecD [Sandarakinorhabdus sp. AAP62]|uniref:protein translocase subunit SecD n=1 Tax=Sandarakinorhabdus sp. AAP62 TaxID=1248916 RepID=UPI000315DCEC|nr:protein translocase subunit SecD [Sandarakinorhabdus sp. AAP62]